MSIVTNISGTWCTAEVREVSIAGDRGNTASRCRNTYYCCVNGQDMSYVNSAYGIWYSEEPEVGSKPSMIDLINWEE